ncbi:MAG: methyltransferase family protein [bacterium]
MQRIVVFGRLLYRFRSLIALTFFIFLVISGSPKIKNITPHLLILLGIVIRIWASGYIGSISRGNKIDGHYRILNGPYQIFPHPVYLGNLFLVLGTILLFNPPLWYGLVLIIIFLVEYTIITIAEENHLKDLPPKRVSFSLRNLKGEISTIIVISIIYFISYLRNS